MKKFFVKIFTVFILLFASLEANEEYFIEKITATSELLSHQKNLVWKDFDLLATPLVITFSNGHVYAFGLNKKHPAWQEKKIGNTSLLFSEQDHWNLSEIVMQDKFILDGQEAFIFRIEEEENLPGKFIERPLLVLIHELFHRYQFGHFESVKDYGSYQDQQNRENLALIQIEEQLLFDYFAASKENRLDILKNYLAVYLSRSKINAPGSLKWEEFQQRMEGLADYASIQTFGTFALISHFSKEKHLSYLLTGYIQARDPQELAVKWRHYGVGAALGFILDDLNIPNWKERVEKGEPQALILEQAIALQDQEINDRLELMKKRYDYEKIFISIEDKINISKNRIDAFLAEYEAENGIIAHIGRPLDVGINGGGTNYGIFHLEDGKTLLVNDRSFSASSDHLWEIEFKNIPFFFQDKAGDRILKVDPDLMLFINGVPHKAEELIKSEKAIPFNTLYWECATSKFKSSEKKGEIYFKNQEFFVNFL